MRRSLLGAGAHRTLESWAAVVCNSGPDSAANAAGVASCELALLQPLPPAVFADPYELQGAARAGAGPPTRLFGPVDVESIEARSQATLLATYAPVTLFPQQVGGGWFYVCVCVVRWKGWWGEGGAWRQRSTATV